MYFKQRNKTALHSQGMISDALFSLMKRKPFHQITVTELCEEAAVGRKTFYRHFELREDVIDFKLDRMLEEYKEELYPLTTDQYLYHHFAYIQSNADVFITLHQNGLSSMAIQKFSVLLPDTMPIWSKDPLEQVYRSTYIIAGIEAVQRLWISHGCTETIGQVLAIVAKLQNGQIPLVDSST